jgi:hypothetical protein
MDPLVDGVTALWFGGREADLTATAVHGDRLRVQ